MLYKDFYLLVDGKNTFPEIISEIEKAKKSIVINMFIWRDDVIGNKLAEAVLKSAERGVEVYISVDRYGVVLEKSEENKKSFFHKKQTFIEKFKAKLLSLLYKNRPFEKTARDVYSDLYYKIINHPNITVIENVFKADHSKYYVIDNNILFLGGINVEDKENGADLQGRVYQDYMVKIVGEEYVKAFFNKLKSGINQDCDYYFGINSKEITPRFFEMKKLYLDLINSARKKLCIVMAYFSPLKEFVNAIVNAVKRKVEVTLMMPKNANFQNASNYKTIKKLLKKTGNEINVYLSPKMLHTKLMFNEDWITFGSTNITKKAFNQLSELNLFVKNDNSNFINNLHLSINENLALSKKVTDYKQVKYNRFSAFFEGIFV